MKDDKQDLITKSITDKKDAKNILFKLWNDSVISQIIASGILILIPVFTAFIVKFLDYKNVKTLFRDFLRLEVKLYILLLISIILILLYFLYLKFIKNKNVVEKNILNEKVGFYRFGDLNNILLTTEIELPDELAFKAGTNNLNLLTAFEIFLPYFNSGIDWDHPTSEGSFIYYNLGPTLMSYGLCEKIPSLSNNTDGNINSYEFQTSTNGYKFFALLETIDRIRNSKAYMTEFENKNKASH
jgi:hypothetical protein